MFGFLALADFMIFAFSDLKPASRQAGPKMNTFGI